MVTILTLPKDSISTSLPQGYINCVLEEKTFPNGEVLVRISDDCELDGRVAIYLKPFPNANTNLIKLIQALDALEGLDFKGRVTVVLSYLPYSRQDKRFRRGEPLSLRIILNMLQAYKVDTLISFDVHNVVAVTEMFGRGFVNVSLLPLLLDKVLSKQLNKNVLLVAPDKGRKPTVHSIANRLGLDYIVMSKTRDRVTGEVSFDFSGVTSRLSQYDMAIIMDDEISTGGTMAGVAGFLKRNDIDEVVAISTHLFLIGEAEKRLFSNGVSKIVGTDSVNDKYVEIRIEEVLPSILGLFEESP